MKKQLLLCALLVPFIVFHGHAAPITSFNVKISGSGQPMILIPGLASSGDTWTETVQHFKGRYTCHVLTLAGFAGTAPIEQRLLATVRDELAVYIREKKLSKPVMVGHSLGGNVVMDFAEKYPDLAGPLVIVDSLPFYASAWFGAKDIEAAKPNIEAMRAYMSARTPEQYLQYTKSGAATNDMVTAAERKQQLIAWASATDMRTLNEATIDLVSNDLRPGLPLIKSPVLVIGTWIGLQEQLARENVKLARGDFVATFKDQFAGVSQLRFAMSDAGRHFVMWDDPAWFDAQLEEFLKNPAAATKIRGF